MKYIILISMSIFLFLSNVKGERIFQKDDSDTTKERLFIQSIDSIITNENIFYVIKLKNLRNEPIKIMSYISKDYKVNNGIRLLENNTYDFKIVTWFRTTYFNEMECFVFDNAKFCRDSIYNDIYGALNMDGLYIIEDSLASPK